MNLKASAPTKRVAHFGQCVQAASIKTKHGSFIDPATTAEGKHA
jgi:hypothetical protein